MRKALVLGGTGFLGRHVAAALLAAGWAVRTASRGGDPRRRDALRIDLAGAGPATLAVLLDALRPDVVVNCAGATDADPRGLAAMNAGLPERLVTALTLGPPCRLVHLGSAAEYGATPLGSAVAEDHPARPVGAYGTSKLAGTLLVGLGRAAGLDAVVLRVFNPVGPGAPTTTLLGRLAAELGTGPPDAPLRLGALSATRDFVDVRDVAEAVVAAASAGELVHGIVNVGSGEATVVRELVEQLVAEAATGREVLEDGDGSARSSVVPWQQADVSLALGDLGWKPARSLRAAVADCWAASRAKEVSR